MPAEGHRAEQKIDALIEMIGESGASPSGNLPPTDYLDSLRDAPMGRADEVREAHREQSSPPAFGGGG